MRLGGGFPSTAGYGQRHARILGGDVEDGVRVGLAILQGPDWPKIGIKGGAYVSRTEIAARATNLGRPCPPARSYESNRESGEGVTAPSEKAPVPVGKNWLV